MEYFEANQEQGKIIYSLLIFVILLEVLANTIKTKKKKIKGIQSRKGEVKLPNYQMTRECYVENVKESTKEATRTNT